MVDAGGVVIWLGSAAEDLVRGTVSHTSTKPSQLSPFDYKFTAPPLEPLS